MFELDKGLLGESELFQVYFSLKAEGRDTEASQLLQWAYDKEMNPSKGFRDAMVQIQLGAKWR